MIACVGLCCVDYIFFCNRYPVEDTDTRVQLMVKSRGGNASNNTRFLQKFGLPTAFLGTLPPANDPESKFVLNDFHQDGVCTDYCYFQSELTMPVSTVILNHAIASRTILHYRDKLFQEYSFQKFDEIPLSSFLWVHFEGRYNTSDMLKMLTKCHIQGVPTSLELEKTNPDLDNLIPYADVIFLSKDYAQMRGWSSHLEAVQQVGPQTRSGSITICTWGKSGSAACYHGTDQTDQLISTSQPCCQQAPISRDRPLTNTLSAGDSFVSAAVALMVSGKLYRNITSSLHVEKGLQILLRFASNVAAEKCAAEEHLSSDICKLLFREACHECETLFE